MLRELCGVCCTRRLYGSSLGAWSTYVGASCWSCLLQWAHHGDVDHMTCPENQHSANHRTCPENQHSPVCASWRILWHVSGCGNWKKGYKPLSPHSPSWDNHIIACVTPNVDHVVEVTVGVVIVIALLFLSMIGDTLAPKCPFLIEHKAALLEILRHRLVFRWTITVITGGAKGGSCLIVVLTSAIAMGVSSILSERYSS